MSYKLHTGIEVGPEFEQGQGGSNPRWVQVIM